MSMFYCRGCGKEIHESAETCPSCGAPQKVVAAGGNKSKVVAALLALFLGALGIHRFYLGQWWGLFYLLLCWTGIPSLISFIEAIVFLLSNQQNWDNKYNDGVSSGESSGVVVALLLIVMFFGGVAVIGILAAVAIPSYQDYTARAQVSEGVALLSSYKTHLAKYYADNRDFTGLENSDLDGVKSGKYVDTVSIGMASGDTIVLVATFKQTGVNAGIQGKEFRLATEDGGVNWACGYGIQNPVLIGNSQLASKYLPGACK